MLNYYPFGMLLPGRNGSSDSYRYGYNSMEKDDEIKGNGNSYDYGLRMYDPRLAKFISIDPVIKHHESPYVAHSNNPIWFIDVEGADTVIAITYTTQQVNGLSIQVYTYEKVEQTSEVGSQLVFQISSTDANGVVTNSTVTGWRSASNPNGLDPSSGVGARLSSTNTYYKAGSNRNAPRQIVTGKMYKYINVDDGDPEYFSTANTSDRGYPINGFGFSFDVLITFQPDKVNLTSDELENYNSAMSQLNAVVNFFNQDLILQNPLTGNNVRIDVSKATITVTGYHSPEPSNYSPPNGTEAASSGLSGNAALDVNRASSVAQYLISNTPLNGSNVNTNSGGAAPQRKVTISN